MIRCLKCDELKKESSFVKKYGSKPFSICFSCKSKFPIDEITNSVCIKNEHDCLLWPDKGRTDDYYNNIRRMLSSECGKYIHVRCQKECVNKQHFFYFESNCKPYWFRYGLNSEINFDKPSEEEIVALKSILMDRVSFNDECWLFGDAKSKKAFIKLGNKSFSSKKIYYETFNSKITEKMFAISASCGQINCVAPKHLSLFEGRKIPFWARKNLKKPEPETGYCQNSGCANYSVLLAEKELRKHRDIYLCNQCFNVISPELKKKKAQYDVEYSEKNREIIRERYKVWAKTDAGKNSQIASSHNRRDKSLRKVNKQFVNDLLSEYNSCCYCNRSENEITIHPSGISKFHLEHIIPILSKKERGTNDSSNLEIACWQCNSMKKNLLPKDWLALLLRKIKFCKNQERINLYNKIIKTLSEESNFDGIKFIPRHIRNKNA